MGSEGVVGRRAEDLPVPSGMMEVAADEAIWNTGADEIT